MLDVFFTNKIPGTNRGWTDELIHVASIFNGFDGLPYNGEEVKQRFEVISKRLPDARDAADYRDEYGAYPSYLGLMNYENGGDHWICKTSDIARDYLCNELPDSNAFMRLQMALLQYPNPIGAQFYENGRIRIEAQSLKKRILQLSQGIKISPFRIILRTLLALYEKYGYDYAYLSYEEIWFYIFQNPRVYKNVNIDSEYLASVINKSRNKNDLLNQSVPNGKLRNLHILTHTGLISKSNSRLSLSSAALDSEKEFLKIANQIANLDLYFDLPQKIDNKPVTDWTKNALSDGSWAEYFSGRTLKSPVEKAILESFVSIETDLFSAQQAKIDAPLQNFTDNQSKNKIANQVRKADPEETKTLRERANLQHRLLVALLSKKLKANDIEPKFNTFIDLCCDSPQKLLFEVKSCNSENQLEQIRKAISQLYEYRYRHSDMKDSTLVLALEEKPKMDWMVDYLVTDRNISLCWLEGEENLACPKACQEKLSLLVDRTEG